jgi:hypothetical protein
LVATPVSTGVHSLIQSPLNIKTVFILYCFGDMGGTMLGTVDTEKEAQDIINDLNEKSGGMWSYAPVKPLDREQLEEILSMY